MVQSQHVKLSPFFHGSPLGVLPFKVKHSMTALFVSFVVSAAIVKNLRPSSERHLLCHKLKLKLANI